MIRSIRHKGLRRLFYDDDPRGLIPAHVQKLKDILAQLDAALTVHDMNLPGLRLHPLKGQLEGFWAVVVRANWRVVFRFEDGEALEVELIDYH